MAGEIFISYRRSDQDKARLLHALLKQRGVDAWYDALVGAGEDWRHKTAQALGAAPIFVLLFSKVASESDDISKELAAATFSKKLVIPVRIDDIKPEGAFLYELASRNWFDAFNDTEARFEILADKLAALVKGGPEADVAAFNLGSAQPAPVIKPAARPLFKQPLVLAGIALAAVAVVSIAAMPFLWPKSEPTSVQTQSQRIAFFGFTTASDDPAAKAMAEAATDQMFQAMGLNKLDTAARGETLGTLADKRLTRAAELGSLYALSGEVRSDKNEMTLSVRFEDVPSRTTIWENSFSGPASETAYLPAQASFATNDVIRCHVRYRSRLMLDSDQELKALAERCRAGATITDGNSLKAVAASRDLAQAEPSSAFVHAYLAVTLALSLPSTPASARPARIAEAEAALKRATELDPKETFLILSRFRIAEGKAVPLLDLDAMLLDALAQAEGKDTTVVGLANATYSRLLQAAGRSREALPYVSAAIANNQPSEVSGTGMPLATLGQSSRARAEYEQAFALYPTAVTWSEWTTPAIFLGAGDAEAMLKSPPSFVLKSVADCFRDIRKAYVSKDAKARSLGARRASECGNAGDLSPQNALTSLAALGDLDAAFALASKQPKLNAFSVRTAPLRGLFWPTSRAMRADPRFLPLVEKLGLMEYWRATKSQPDVCETEDVPFCRELKQAARP
jgi:TolB-like protein/Flp pilus assembly protein TadD